MENREGFAQNAFLGEKARNVGLVKKIDDTAEKINKILNPIDDAAKRKTEGDSIKLIRGLGIQVDKVTTLNETLIDRNKTQDQKANAKGVLDILANSTYIALKYGEKGKFARVVEAGSVMGINDILPEALKGLGEKVRDVEIKNTEIKKVLDNLDKKGRVLKVAGEGGKRKLSENLEDAIEQLSEIENLDAKGYKEIMIVSAYLGAEIEKLYEPGEGGQQREKGTEGQEEDIFPEGYKEQLVLARILLEKVESSQRTTRDPYLGQYAAKLEEFAGRVDIDPDVAIEIRSRLKLHDSSVLMRKANGYIDAPRSGGDPECPTVGMAATLAEGMGHALDNEAIGFFLKSEANGLPTALAWDKYQNVNCSYRRYLEAIQPGLSGDLKIVVDNDPDMGTIDATYFTDSDPRRKKLVDDRVIEEIVSTSGVDVNLATKAWELIKKMSIATGENAVFNSGLTGNDEMAEDIYLKKYRQGRDVKGRTRGPQITIDKISGLGNSWLRKVSGYQPYNEKSGVKPLFTKDIVVEPDPKEHLGIEDGSYVFQFGAWWSAKIHPLRDLLLDRQPDPQKMLNIDFFQNAVDYFNKADPDGSKKLRRYWIAGVLDMACSIGSLGWTQDDISKFRQFATKIPLSKDAGVFLDRYEWDDIMERGKFVGKMLQLDGKRIWQNYAFGGGSKKR